MAATQVRSTQLEDGGVKRIDLNTATSGDAVITKAIAGTGISLSSTGADAGTGDVTFSTPANSTNQKVEIMKGGASIGTRKTINLIEGTGVTMTVADDSGNDRVNVTINASGGGGGLTNFTESVNTSTPNATVPAVQLVATNAATNVDAVLTPKGTGALLAQIPDNASTGGNKRGVNAVDLQTIRTAAGQVASGQKAVIAGGYSNTASGDYSTVAGGNTNIASNGYSAIAGGDENTASAFFSAIGGGTLNTASGKYANVPGGQNNTAKGYSQTVIGQFNSALPTSANTTSFTVTDPALIIGNGTSGSPSNCCYITFDGIMFLGSSAQTQITNTTGKLKHSAIEQNSASTNQVLAWNGTTWAPATISGGSSPLTTKGDIYTRSSSADARLAVGTNDQTLVADSSATNGVAWRDSLTAFFGDGSDGAITFDGTTTLLGIVPSSSTYQLTRDIFLADGSTINSGVIIDTHGWRILCQGTLTNNGTIQSNGSVSSSGGNGANTNSVGGGTKGANGRSTAGAGANGTNSAGYAFGGVGGTGGGNTGTAGVGGTITTGNPNSPRDLASFLSGVAIFPLEAGSTVYALMGGTGGGAGAYASGTKSGAGGGGGGTVHIRARHIINTSGTIQALGGAGTAATGTGNADGGGGGGGGKVELLYQTRTGNTPLVTGGVGGAGIGTGATGATGSSGNIYYNQV
jgi:hypothetical protein